MSDVPGTTDAEVLRVLRARVRRLEGAIGAYLDSMREIATTVGPAWERLEDAVRRREPDDAAGATVTAAFLAAYANSRPHRKDALQALIDAVVEDFKTAVLTSEDMTEGQRAHWMALCDAEGKEQGQ